MWISRDIPDHTSELSALCAPKAEVGSAPSAQTFQPKQATSRFYTTVEQERQATLTFSFPKDQPIKYRMFVLLPTIRGRVSPRCCSIQKIIGACRQEERVRKITPALWDTTLESCVALMPPEPLRENVGTIWFPRTRFMPVTSANTVVTLQQLAHLHT